MSNELDGIDASHWQGKVDWDEAVHAIGFAMLKATQGTNYVDPTYAGNITALRQNGERRGSYHWPNGGDPKAEAGWYVHHAGRQNGEMQALDFEGDILNHADPVGWAAAWLAEVFRLTGNRPLIYMSGSVCTRFDWSRVVQLDVGLWVASWQTTEPTHLGAWKFAIMWQRDDDGHLAGIDGRVDQDVFFGDSETWQKYANNSTLPASPPPAPVPAPPKPPATPPGAVYTVKHGDTLSGIGNAHDVTVHQLVAANEHRYPSLGWNPDLIQVGWQLVIPDGKAPAAPAPFPTHVVVAGDTLSELAGVYKTSVAELVKLNEGKYPSLKTNADHIEVGWVLAV